VSELEKVRKFLEILSADFGVRPPRINLEETLGGMDVVAWYLGANRTITLRKGLEPTLDVLLHEFYHHLELEQIAAGRWKRKLEPSGELLKPHCERIFERKAKFFASDFYDFYKEVWEKLVRGG
jgi:hypothetical protein